MKLTFEKQSNVPAIYIARLEGKRFAEISKHANDSSYKIEIEGVCGIFVEDTTLADAKATVKRFAMEIPK